MLSVEEENQGKENVSCPYKGKCGGNCFLYIAEMGQVPELVDQTNVVLYILTF